MRPFCRDGVVMGGLNIELTVPLVLLCETRVRKVSDSTNQSGTRQDLDPDDEFFDGALAEAARRGQARKTIMGQA